MLPSEQALFAALQGAHTDVAPASVDRRALRRALAEAEHLADDTFDVAAALHFALSRQPRLQGARMAHALAAVLPSHLQGLGLQLRASAAELAVRLSEPPRDLADARDWFAERLVVYGG